MNSTERYLELAKEIEALTGTGASELKSKVEEFAELRLAGADESIDFRIQDILLPNLIAQEDRSVWWGLWEVSEEWVWAETLTELYPNPKALEVYELADWEDWDMQRDAAFNLGIDVSDDEEDEEE